MNLLIVKCAQGQTGTLLENRRTYCPCTHTLYLHFQNSFQKYRNTCKIKHHHALDQCRCVNRNVLKCVGILNLVLIAAMGADQTPLQHKELFYWSNSVSNSCYKVLAINLLHVLQPMCLMSLYTLMELQVAASSPQEGRPATFCTWSVNLQVLDNLRDSKQYTIVV